MAHLDPWTSLEAARFGLYVHFPYCLAKCPYCDFAVTVAKTIPQERYTQGLLAELRERVAAHPGLSGRTLDSLFIGGGTPSLWAADKVAQLLDAVRGTFPLASESEVSLEANPEVCELEQLRAYRAAGVNRLSIGIQSFHEPVLRTLGRDHRPADAKRAIDAAKKAGFGSVCVDLIYGVPGQTVAQAKADAELLVQLGVDHVSAYALTVDRPSLALETVMSRQVARGDLVLPVDDEVVDMAAAIEDALLVGKLQRYEISNFAKSGQHSRHNALYWTGGECLALGTGATGLLLDAGGKSAVRTTNLRSAEKFLSAVESGKLPNETTETLGPKELFAERLAMGLRLASGVDLKAVCEAYGEEPAPRVVQAERLVADGFAVWNGPRLALTRKGGQVHSEIAARLL